MPAAIRQFIDLSPIHQLRFERLYDAIRPEFPLAVLSDTKLREYIKEGFFFPKQDIVRKIRITLIQGIRHNEA